MGTYSFNYDDIKSGDIVLTKNKGLISRGIQLAGNEYSHALICSTPPTLIEANKDGVTNFSARNCVINDINNIKILRLKNSVDNHAEIAKKAGDEAACFLSTVYDLKQAIATVRKNILPERGRIFCSELVAKSYERAGLTLLEGVVPDLVQPGDLLKSPYLEDKTLSLCHENNSGYDISGRDEIDGKKISNPIRNIALVEQGAFLETRLIWSPVFQKYHLRTPGNIRDVICGFTSISVKHNGLPNDVYLADSLLNEKLKKIYQETSLLLSEGLSITLDSISKFIIENKDNSIVLKTRFEKDLPGFRENMEKQKKTSHDFNIMVERHAISSAEYVSKFHKEAENSWRDIVNMVSSYV